MSPSLASTLFTICNAAVVPFWGLLLFAPRSTWTRRLVHAPWVALALAPVYVWGLASGGAPEGAGMSSLEGVVLAFSAPAVTLGAWIHYLIFDLFVGAWEARDAQRHGVPHWMLVPCLLFTLMLGPTGLFLYIVVRWFVAKQGIFSERLDSPATE